MASILVRNLDEKVVKRLKQRAQRDGRSLQAEVKIILEEAANPVVPDWATARAMAEEIQAKFKGRKFPDSAALIREDRDR